MQMSQPADAPVDLPATPISGTVTIEFCLLDEAYSNRFKEVAEALELRYPHVQVLGNLDEPRPGAFEVVSQNSGKVFFSKLETGEFPTALAIVEAVKSEFGHAERA